MSRTDAAHLGKALTDAPMNLPHGKTSAAVARPPALTADVNLVRVASEEDARRRRFLGSPTVRVGGRDVEPEAGERRDFGLKCRLYRTADGLTGLPSDEWILAALRRPMPARLHD